MNSDDFFSRKMREAELFDKITANYAKETLQMETAEDIADFLQGVLDVYEFKRVDRVTFFVKDGKESIRKETNGYFLAKQALFYDLQARCKESKTLTVKFVCPSCGNYMHIDVMQECNEIVVHSTEGHELSNLDLEIISKSGKSTLVKLSFQGRFGRIIKQRLLEQGYNILEIFINRNTEFSEILATIYLFRNTCNICTEGKTGGDKQGDRESNRNNKESLKNKPHKDNHKPTVQNDQSSSKVEAHPTDLEIEGSAIEDRKDILTSDSFDTVPESGKENHISDELFYSLHEEITQGLSRTIPSGKYIGKSFQWIIAFNFEYLEEMLENNDPEDELKYFLKDLVRKGEAIGIEQFPELVELKQRLSW